MFSKRAYFNKARTIVAASITGAWTAVDLPFDKPLRAFKITNGTDGNVWVTDDTVKGEVWFIPANAFDLWDVSANSSQIDDKRMVAGTQFYVKEDTTPTSGRLVITALDQ